MGTLEVDVKLILAEMDVDPKIEKLFKAAFAEAVDVLKLAKSNAADVLLKFEQPEHIRQNDGSVSTTLGRTDQYVKDGFIRMAISAVGTLDRAIHTFAHEMVHVEQMVRGALRRDDDKVYWNDRLVPIHVLQHAVTDNASYTDLPWEVEARHVGAQVFQRIIEKVEIPKPELPPELEFLRGILQ